MQLCKYISDAASLLACCFDLPLKGFIFRVHFNNNILFNFVLSFILFNILCINAIENFASSTSFQNLCAKSCSNLIGCVFKVVNIRMSLALFTFFKNWLRKDAETPNTFNYMVQVDCEFLHDIFLNQKDSVVRHKWKHHVSVS